MQSVKIVVWEVDGHWVGYLQNYPDYWTQGKTLQDLRDHLIDLHKDVTGGGIPGIRRVEDMVLPCVD
jgi:predicted RNase H-like HicB family nuclease